MAVVGYREVIPRTYEHKLGGNPTASRVFIATVDEPTPSSAVVGAIGISHGSGHPDHAGLTCDGYSVDETDRHHVTVTYTYSVSELDNEDPENSNPPWLQPDRWQFSTTNASAACTYWYEGVNNNKKRTITNAAGDPIFGLSKAEAELRITISGSRLTIDLQRIKKLVNAVNKVEWAGFPQHTVQCVGISASPDRLEWEGQTVNFWQLNTELLYRSSSHNLILPNVGWNVIVNGKKERAWTYITQDGVREKVPAPHPVALNLNGGFLCGPDQDGASDAEGGTEYTDDGTGYYEG